MISRLRVALRKPSLQQPTQIFIDRANSNVDDIAKTARAAMEHDAVHPGTFSRWFRAELEKSVLRPEVVDNLVRLAQVRMRRGLPVMDDRAMVLR